MDFTMSLFECFGALRGRILKATRSGLVVGDRVHLSGGYEMPPAWLGGAEAVDGEVVAFVPTDGGMGSVAVRLDAPLTHDGDSGNVLVLSLRYAGAAWGRSGIVHLELCESVPENRPPGEQVGIWIESHASYRKLKS